MPGERRRRGYLVAEWRRSVPVVKFVGLYVALLLLFQIFYYQLVVGSAPFAVYLTWSGRAASVLLRAVGDSVVVSGDTMTSAFVMSIKQGCDGLQAMAVLVVGMAIFPTAWRARMLGALAGVLLLLALNVLRIASLFWFGQHRFGLFQTMHVHVWPAVLILFAVGFWAVWASLVPVRKQAA